MSSFVLALDPPWTRRTNESGAGNSILATGIVRTLHFLQACFSRQDRLEYMTTVGGPGFEPGASRSRTGRMSCPPVSCRFLRCPPVPNALDLRVLSFPSVSFWFCECVTFL